MNQTNVQSTHLKFQSHQIDFPEIASSFSACSVDDNLRYPFDLKSTRKMSQKVTTSNAKFFLPSFHFQFNRSIK